MDKSYWNDGCHFIPLTYGGGDGRVRSESSFLSTLLAEEEKEE
jgi:hypothetical protein